MNLSLFPRRPLRKTIVFSKTHKSPIKIVSGKPGSPVSASDVSKPIFEIKATEDKTKIYTPMLSGSGQNVPPFGYLYSSASSENSGGGFCELLMILSDHLRARPVKILLLKM